MPRLVPGTHTTPWRRWSPAGIQQRPTDLGDNPFKLSELKDVDVTTTPPANGWTLAWETNKWVAQNGTARNAFARGDGGNFTAGSLQGFVFGVYGAGNFATSAVDEPVEINSSALDGGSF